MLDKDHISRSNDRSSQIRDELATLYTEQSDFYRDGARTKHTPAELAECENRRQLIRRLFQELDELRKTDEWHYAGGKPR
jgi:hypothetical protein